MVPNLKVGTDSMPRKIRLLPKSVFSFCGFSCGAGLADGSFQKLGGGVPTWGPHVGDRIILGSILGPRCFWETPVIIGSRAFQTMSTNHTCPILHVPKSSEDFVRYAYGTYAYMNIHTHIDLYIYIYIYIEIYVCKHLCICTYVSMYFYTSTYI